MASGKVQCYGSSLFLKNRYGVGYHMVMVKTQSCDVSKVEEVVFRHIPTAELESDIGKIYKSLNCIKKSRALLPGFSVK